MASPPTLNPPPVAPPLASDRAGPAPWLWVPGLYFMQALPNVLVSETFGTAFKDLGVDNLQIALWTGLATLPWSFKMFWGPLVDLSFTKRQWTVTMQVLLTGALAIAAGAMLTQGYFAIAVAMLFIIAIGSATHDIACDGLYLMSLDKTRQAAFSGVMATCSRLGRLFAQSILIAVAGMVTRWGLDKQAGWAVALGVAAVIYGAGMLWNFFALPRPAVDRPATDVAPGERGRNVLRTLAIVGAGVAVYFFFDATLQLLGYAVHSNVAAGSVPKAWALAIPDAGTTTGPVDMLVRNELVQQVLKLSACLVAIPLMMWLVRAQVRGSPMADAFLSYVRQPGFAAILGFIIFYRFGEAMIFSMTKFFMLDPPEKGGMGVSLEKLAVINGIGMVGGLIVGGLLGGWFISRVGLRRAFWPLVVCMHLPNLLYVWIAFALPTNHVWLYPVVFTEACGYGFGFAGYFVYLMHVAQRDKGPGAPAGAFTTSHYAIGTGLGALFITFATILGGIVQSVFGYTGVFIAACLFTIPGTLILLVIPLDTSEGRGIKAHAE